MREWREKNREKCRQYLLKHLQKKENDVKWLDWLLDLPAESQLSTV
jgi:hypothetical protein